MINSVYSDDVTFWHPALTVGGKQDLLGVARLWTFLFKDLEVYTRRVGVAHNTSSSLISWGGTSTLKNDPHCSFP